MLTPAQARVQAAIDRRAARGEAITVRGVQEEMLRLDGQGASFGTITPVVKAWNRAHGGDAAGIRCPSASNDLAKALSRAGTAMARAVEGAIAQAVATQRAQDVIAIERLQEAVAALSARIAALEAELARRGDDIKRVGTRQPNVGRTSSVSPGVATLDGTSSALPAVEPFDQSSGIQLLDGAAVSFASRPRETALPRAVVDRLVPAVRREQDKAAVAAFNHHVVQDIFIILEAQAQRCPDIPSLSAREIIVRLPTEVLHRIQRWNGRPTTTADIHRIIRNRILHKRYVRRVGRGQYAAFTDWRERKGVERRERAAAKISR